MEKLKKIPWRLLVALFAVHLFVSLIFILVSSTTHPLFAVLKSLPLVAQILVSCVLGTVLYIVPGYLIIVSQVNHDDMIKHIDTLMALFTLILLIVFAVSFASTFLNHTKQGWLIYATANPVIGLLIYNLYDTSATWWDLFWALSTFVPALGMMIGMYLRLKREGAIR